MVWHVPTLRSFLISLLVIATICIFLAYILFQSRFLIEGPSLVLHNEHVIAQTEQFVTLEGTAGNIVYISINDRPILTTESGYFKERILLQTGYNIVRVEARDRYGRTKYIEREFVADVNPIIET